MVNDRLMLDRDALIAWYRRNRARTRTLFDLLADETYYSRPIELRHPIVFYEGHLPAFSLLSFLRRGLGHGPINERLEKLFERGIDPDSAETAVPRSGAGTTWPSRDQVLAFGARADEAIVRALESAEFFEVLLTALQLVTGFVLAEVLVVPRRAAQPR